MVAARVRDRTHHHKSVFGMSRNSHIALYTAAFVQHQGIGHTPHSHCNIVGTDPLQEHFGIRAFDHQLAQHGVVDHRDIFAGSLLFRLRIVEPVLAAKAVVDLWRDTIGRKPARTFPALSFSKACTARLHRMIEWRPAQITDGFTLTVRPMHGIGQHQCFGTAVLQIDITRLKFFTAAGLHFTEVNRRMTLHDPLRECTACARTGLNTGRVHAS